jgi:eukaryotic-like serine/threonine-protein kinase
MKNCPTCGKQYEDTNTLCPDDGAVLKRSGDDPLVGQVLSGKYRVEEKLAEGGMGCVYKATHVLMEKTVAIKVLHAALSADDKIVARFTREAKAASRISHPHALTVTDFGEAENGVVFLVMEYLDGRTLKQAVREGGPMPLARVVQIVRQVGGALQAAHEQGVVHRDLKSDNIMLVETGGGDWAKVLDFGIAKITDSLGAADPGLTAPNIIIGTPQYMSPEQCGQSAEIDARSDIYSFGVILYEMLAGRVPFTGETPTAIMMKHVQEPAPSILEARRDLPAEVGRVVARALAKSPDERFQTAAEFAQAFVRAAEAEPPAASAAAPTDTDRIIVPTAPLGSRETTSEELDEMTVVSGEVRPPAGVSPPRAAAPPAPSFNLGRIVLFSVAALAVVFAVVFALQRRGAVGGETQSPVPQLTPAPDGVPAQAIAPPTGQAETVAAPVTAATPAAGVPGELPAQTLPDPGSFAVPELTPPPGSEAGANTNADANTNTNQGGQGEAATKPSPTATPREQRTPAVVVSPDDNPPPPAPTPERRRQAAPKPTPAPTTQAEGGAAGDNMPS